MSVAKVAAWVDSADIVIAADSGMLRVLEAGYVPDVVVGDFDSISIELVSPETKTVVDLQQDDTDCSKLLTYVKSQGYSRVTLICAEGDLSDHFLDTVHCAVRTDLDVWIGLERGIAHVLSGPIARKLKAKPGARVSMLPLETVHGAHLSGVEWPFTDQTLSIRGFTSISNKAVEDEVNVSFQEGSAYLFIECNDPCWFLDSFEPE